MDAWLPNMWLAALTASSALILVTYAWLTRHHAYFAARNLPFIKPSPLVGNFGPYLFRQKSLSDFLADTYQSMRDSAVVGFFEFMTPVYMIHDPALYKRITVKDFEHFEDRRGAIRDDENALFGRGLFLLRGQRWRKMRNTLSPAFTSSKMKGMFLLVTECAKQLTDYLEEKCSETADGLATLELKDVLSRYATDVITTTAFGVHCDSFGDQHNEFRKAGNDLTSLGGRNGMVMIGYMICERIMKLLGITFITRVTSEFFRNVIKTTIETREREGIVRPDMLHLMRQAQKGTLKTADVTDEPLEGREDNKGQKTVFSDDDLVAQAVLFFFGGFETSSTLLCFLTHQLAVHPEIQERLQREVDEVLEEDGGKLTYEGLQRMKYMDMVISETLRMYPPGVFIDRVCVKPYTIPATATSPEIKLSRGDGIMYPVVGIHRDPEYWPEPMKFDPERFSEANKDKIVPCTYTPFGEGPRGCIGMRFALMEVKIAFAYVFSRFESHVVDRTVLPARLQKGTFNVTLEGGFWLGLKPRNRSLSQN